MRRLVKIFIAIGFFVFGVGLFIFYFPQIWGDILLPYHYREDFVAAREKHKDICPTKPRHLSVAFGFVESGLNPAARSRAGALGIMQIIPSTAAGLAAEEGIKDFSADMLISRPDINILLGDRYICKLYAKYNGDLTLVAAHYNYGPRAGGPRETWPRETQRFVVKIRDTFDAYNSLYGPNDEGPIKPFAIEQPKSFLSVISVKNLLNLLSGQ